MTSKLRSFYVLTLCEDAGADPKYHPVTLRARSKAQAEVRATLRHRKVLAAPQAKLTVLYLEEKYG